MKKNTQSDQPAIALDIGGTRIKAALIEPDGTLLYLVRSDSPANAHPDEVVPDIVALIENLCVQNHLDLDDVQGVGVSIAAFIQASGLVTATAHLSQSWVGYKLGMALQNSLKTSFFFALDTPAPALGEAYFGAGKGYDNFVYVTVSTGIGAGIVADGKYFTGGLGWAGGVGHTIIDESSSRICEGCGNAGCLETFAATQGILTTAREVLADRQEGILYRKLCEDNELSPALIHTAAQEGDPNAQEIWERVGHALGLGLVNMIDIVAPERVVVGGGIAQAGEFLLGPARNVVRERAFPPALREVEIVQASLGDLSGVYGAAALVFYDLHINE